MRSSAISSAPAEPGIAVAELKDGVLVPAGLLKFGLGGKELWQRLDGLRADLSARSGLVPLRAELVAAVRYFERYRTGWIRDGVLLWVGWQSGRSKGMDLKGRADRLLREVNPSYRLKRKHEEELSYWKGELNRLEEWFQKSSTDWWGIHPPTPNQKENISDLWIVNAVMTMHSIRPSYTEELRIPGNVFAGKRVLEVGSGPLAPILQFTDCARHCIDPLVNVYLAAGWPLFDYDAKFINTGGEVLPYPDDYFDAAISVNALDHVDDFERVASEMQRVVRRGGGIYFEVEYHASTVTEPIALNDYRVQKAFSTCNLNMIINRTGQEMFEALVKRFDLLPNQFQRFGEERFVTWHGIRK